MTNDQCPMTNGRKSEAGDSGWARRIGEGLGGLGVDGVLITLVGLDDLKDERVADDVGAAKLVELDAGDITILCDPVYFGGTVDRSEGSERIVGLITEAGGRAEHIPARADCADRMVELARPGDRIVIMGARDDTLIQFAKDILARLP